MTTILVDNDKLKVVGAFRTWLEADTEAKRRRLGNTQLIDPEQRRHLSVYTQPEIQQLWMALCPGKPSGMWILSEWYAEVQRELQAYAQRTLTAAPPRPPVPAPPSIPLPPSPPMPPRPVSVIPLPNPPASIPLPPRPPLPNAPPAIPMPPRPPVPSMPVIPLPPRPVIEQNGIKLPNEGTAGRLFFDTASRIASQCYIGTVSLDEIMRAPALAGMKESSAKVYYGQWRKFRGMAA